MSGSPDQLKRSPDTGAAAPVAAPVAPRAQKEQPALRPHRPALPSFTTIGLKLVGLGPFLFLLLLWVVLSIESPYFFTTLNVTNLLQASSIVAVLAVGQFLIILTGAIDLSAGAVVALCTVIGAQLSHTLTHNGLVIVAIMLATGIAVGIVNATIIEPLRLASPFVVTLGTMSIASGAAFVISGGATVTGLPPLIDHIGSNSVAGIPAAALVVAGFAVVVAALTSRLRWGRWIYAIGGNREAAERVGIPARRVAMSVFVIGGFAAGLAGIIQAGLTDSGQGAASFTAELDAISAVVIGGASLQGGRGTLSGTLVGALILGTIHNGLNLLSVDTNWEPIVLGVVLLLALGTDFMRVRLESRLRLREARQLEVESDNAVPESGRSTVAA